MYSLHITRYITSQCQCTKMYQYHICTSSYVKMLRNTFTSTFVCCSHQGTCVTPVHRFTFYSLIGLKVHKNSFFFFFFFFFLHWTGKKVCEICLHQPCHLSFFQFPTQSHRKSYNYFMRWGFCMNSYPKPHPYKYNYHWDIRRFNSYMGQWRDGTFFYPKAEIIIKTKIWHTKYVR